MNTEEILELKDRIKNLNERLEVMKHRYTIKNADFFCITESDTDGVYILNATINVKDFIYKNKHKMVYGIYTPGTKLINAFIKTHFDSSLYYAEGNIEWPMKLQAPLESITKPIERILKLLSIKYEPLPNIDLINLIYIP